MLWDSKLDQTTPAHVLAASPAIRKELSEKLRTRRVKVGTVSVSGSALKPAYALPLWEIDILVAGTASEAGLLDSGSQIVAISQDLATEVGATINMDVRLRMEGTNGATSWTVGCAEYLPMQVAGIEFQLHAHVLKEAPFRILLGHPFEHALLSSLEDKPGGGTNLVICDPQNHSHHIAVPT